MMLLADKNVINSKCYFLRITEQKVTHCNQYSFYEKIPRAVFKNTHVKISRNYILK
jgi:hypothetical protein